MSGRDRTDVLIEVLEVFINQILYVRQVYPTQIFKKRRIYNSPVFVSIYPPLNNYLQNVLRAARELQRSGDLETVEILLYRNESHIVEHYDMHMSHSDNAAHDSFELEQRLRTALYKMATRLKVLKPLPSDTKFKVLLHTTQESFLRLTNNPRYQEFPWLYESDKQCKAQSEQEISLLPLTHLDQLGLRLDVVIPALRKKTIAV